MGAVPPNAARRRIATTRRGDTFLILSSMKLPLIVGVTVGVAVGSGWALDATYCASRVGRAVPFLNMGHGIDQM